LLRISEWSARDAGERFKKRDVGAKTCTGMRGLQGPVRGCRESQREEKENESSERKGRQDEAKNEN